MITMNESDLATTPSQRTLAIHQQLEQAFACSLGIWTNSQRLPAKWSWLKCDSTKQAWFGRQLSESIYQWFDQLVARPTTEPQLLRLSDNQAMIAAVSESDLGDPEIVAGPVHLDAWSLAQATAQLAVKQASKAEDEEMLEHYATRLSASFEELCFLRRLSKHVDYCVADRPPAEVAVPILPEMRQLLEVEALCLINASKERGSQVYRARSIGGIAGSLPIAESVCCQVVDSSTAIRHASRQGRLQFG